MTQERIAIDALGELLKDKLSMSELLKKL
jgi:hypothetical protein